MAVSCANKPATPDCVGRRAAATGSLLDKSAIGGEALCVVTIGPGADMRIVSETPDAKVVARGGKYDLLCVERKRESECQEK